MDTPTFTNSAIAAKVKVPSTTSGKQERPP
jgi:hypothetical protein